LRVTAYCRVSTSSKDQENSFENQQSYFQREISKNPEWEYCGIYADKGLTGTSTAKRKEFLRMVYDAGIDFDDGKYSLSEREPKFNLILVKNTSRFARNIDVIDLLRKLRQKKVYVRFLDINKSTENEQDFVFIEMLLVFDENESRDKSRKVKFGHLEGARKGVIRSNSRLYGYRKIDKYTLEIIPEEAEIIRFIYENYSKGLGVRRILNLLEEKGYKTREGKNFNKSTVLRILKEEKYKGTLVNNKYTTGTVFVDKHNPKLKPKEKWFIFENRIPAIVSPELWEKCQQIREEHTTEFQKGHYKGQNILVGKIFCGKCGHTYTANTDNGRKFYNCGRKKQYGLKACNNENINADKLFQILETQIKNELQNLYDLKDKIKNVINSLIRLLEQKLKDKNMKKYDENVLIQELEVIQQKEKKLVDLYLEGNISKEVYDDKKKELDAEKANIEEKIKFNQDAEKIILKRIQNLKTYMGFLEKRLPKDPRNLNIVVSDYLDNIRKITVYSKDNVKVECNFDFDFSLKQIADYGIKEEEIFKIGLDNVS
jgi:DNA invertase Pin-like site-specific DNA recombinase